MIITYHYKAKRYSLGQLEEALIQLICEEYKSVARLKNEPSAIVILRADRFVDSISQAVICLAHCFRVALFLGPIDNIMLCKYALS